MGHQLFSGFAGDRHSDRVDAAQGFERYAEPRRVEHPSDIRRDALDLERLFGGASLQENCLTLKGSDVNFEQQVAE
jgi:hypothetical protein